MKKVPPQQAKKRPKPTASLSLFDVIEAELAAVGSGGTPSGTAAPGATGENVVDGAGKQKAGTMAPSLRNLAPSSGPAKLAFPNDRHVADVSFRTSPVV